MKKNLLVSIVLSIVSSVCTSQTQIGTDIDGDNPNDAFGKHVAISKDGTTIIAGAPFASPNSVNFGGYAAVFRENSGSWMQLGSTINGTITQGFLGNGVAISENGNIIAVGSPEAPNGTALKSGRVRVYSYDGTDFTQLGNDIFGEFADDQIGESIALSNNGNIIAIGSPRNSDNNPSNSGRGHVRVFQLIGNTWVQRGIDLDGGSANDQFGFAVALSNQGNVLAVGAYNVGGNAKGQATMFEFNGTDYVQIGDPIDGVADGDFFGSSIALDASGLKVAIGAPNVAADNKGQVRVFQFQVGNWIQIGSNIDGEPFDLLGQSVALSDNGEILAIGIRQDDDGTVQNTGSVALYKNDAGVWKLEGNKVYGEAESDLLGDRNSIAISGDGNRTVMGSRFNDGNGQSSGHIRVFGYSSVLSISNHNIEEMLKVYPNPVNDILNLNLADWFGAKAVLFSIDGKKIIDTVLKEGRMDITKVSKGSYLLRLEKNGEITSKKIIKH